MYITVIDFSTKCIHCIACDVDFKMVDTQYVENTLEKCGYHLSQISYMVTEEEPEYSIIELNDILS